MSFIKNLITLTMLIASFFALDAYAAGSPKATKGGTFKYNLGQAPTTLNALSSTGLYSRKVREYVMETLLVRSVDTYEWESWLASSWSISKDGLVYEFTLRDGVKWHDGKPLTVEDVKFSFEAIVHPKNKYKTAPLKSFYENIKSAEIIGKNKIRFTAKKVYFKNFDVVANLLIVPKHLYENTSKKNLKKLNKTLIGTGPYILSKYQKGKKLILKANKKWWGRKIHKSLFNHDKILMRFVKDGTIAIQRLEKGDLDYNALSAEEYMKKTKSKNWGTKVFKIKAQDKSPKSYGFIGWNLKNKLFKTKPSRLALHHLLNRRLMIDKFRFGLAEPATGPLYRSSVYANPAVKPIEYDPKKALAMLRADGWKDTDGDSVLDKMIDGKKVPFSFTILEPNQEFVKYLTIFKEDAKKAGIDVKIKYVEWNTFIKLLDERKFEAVRLGWGGGSIDWDPKQIWHSDSAGNAGSNFIGYNNPKVDALIDQARVTIDKKKRIKILRKTYKLIADDVPYAFFFNDRYKYYGYGKRMGREKDTYEYTTNSGIDYWWIKQ